MKQRLAKLIATGIYSGYSPLWPGTAGSIPAWLAATYVIRGHTPVLASVTAILFCVSVWSAGEAEKQFGHDSKKIVIDEWAGMCVSLLFIPFSLTNYVIAFATFRLFDVIKVFPAAQSEKLSGGWGVTMDDIVAGIQANIATQLVLYALR
ncbi:MAG TPA: phosphatidylglycerophosphatase A [Candidatus Deferrimicrobium sp.]|nr:phosphatidylglycerophosphatase A [Candidatus Deferrimicrobium sp.]